MWSESLWALRLTVLATNVKEFTSFVLIGDFNINFCSRDHPYFCKLDTILQTFSLSQVVNTHTHTAPSGETSLIDLALVSNPDLVLDCTTVCQASSTAAADNLEVCKCRLSKGQSNDPGSSLG